jgi:hypothetical protein
MIRRFIMKSNTFNFSFILSRCSCFFGVVSVAALMMPTAVFSQTYTNPSIVPLLTAGTYGALAYSSIAGSANVNGDVGTITSTIDGTIKPSGTNWNIVDSSHNTQAQNDLAAALANASGRTNDATIASDVLGGKTLTCGVYNGTALILASGTTLTLNGSPTDIFIIKASSTLGINGGTVSLINGAVWSNVFWYVGSAATILSGSTFNGIILATTSITLDASAIQVTAQLLAHTGAITINSPVLPVELTSFTAALNNGAVELNWNTSTEVNNSGFEIQRSQISNVQSETLIYNWTKIGFVMGAVLSNSPKNYLFVDKTVSYGSYAYRLKQIDSDGNYKYSNVTEVNAGQLPKGYLLTQNYPNPFNPSTLIQFTISENAHATLTIFNVIGGKVAMLFDGNAVAGQVYNVTFNGYNLASGIYYYKLQTNEITEVKKMLFMK